MSPDAARERLRRLLFSGPGCPDLLEAALLLGVDEAPGLAIAPYLRRADELAAAVAERTGAREDPVHRIASLRQVVFEEGGIRGNREDYYDARNSCLHEVIDRRLGIPISLAVLILAIGQRLRWPMAGVSFPGHFLVRYDAGEALYALDPFDGALILGEEEVRDRWVAATGEAPPALAEMLTPASDRLILLRMLNNLKQIALQRREFARAAVAVEKMVLIDPAQPLHHRDLGYLYAWSRRVEPAVSELQRYLRMQPGAEDRDQILGYIQEVSASGMRWDEG